MKSKSVARLLWCGVAISAIQHHDVVHAANSKSADSGNDGDLSVDLSYDYTRGKYGTAFLSTESIYTIRVDYDTENYGFGLTIPYLHQSGPVGTINRRLIRRPISVTRIVSESGEGDVEASVTSHVIDNTDKGVFLDVKGTYKFPTASRSKGLGSGKADEFIEFDAGKDFGNFSGTGTLGYSFLGSPGHVIVQRVGQNIEYVNAYSWSVDGAYKLADKTKFGVTYSAEQATSVGGFKQEDVTVYFSFGAANAPKIRVYWQKGLADGSPDFGTGLSATFNF